MSRPARANRPSSLDVKMEALAQYVLRMEPEEIRAFLDALFPAMCDDEREDLYGSLVLEQRGRDARGRPAKDVFSELDKARGLAR